MTAREVALLVVRDVFPAPGTAERGAQEALEYRFRKASLDARDAAFATELAYGAIRLRRLLDWHLRPFLTDRSKPLPATTHEILRLAMYELTEMRSSQHATTNEWVNLAKTYGHRGLAGLVNAVLRSFQRASASQPHESDFPDRDDYLGVRYSFPTWLVRQWREVFGESRVEDVLAACNEPARTSIVVNRARADRDEVASQLRERGVDLEASPYADDALLAPAGRLVRALEREAGGAWWTQSESSAAVVDVLNPQSDETILDACCGRGSKALQIAARLRGSGRFMCIDRDARKLTQLQSRLEQCGLSAALVEADATSAALAVSADRVLLDAPCSATGVIARHPESRWRKRPDDGARLARTQSALVDALVEHLYPGGVLVYAVCSVDPRETTEVIATAFAKHPLVRGLLPAALEPFETDEGDLLIPPGIEGRDGFFIARLERRP